jgi:hypothetical protein
MVSGARQAIPFRLMSRRIDIELTSSLGDGTWTWRAAGARQPKGVLDGSILPADAKVGDELKVEIEQEIDGITVLGVVHGREKQARSLLELLPNEREFQPVVETRAKRERGERPRRDGDGRRGERRRRDGERGGGRDERGGDRGRDRGERAGGDDRRDGRRRDGGRERRGPSFTPPPEVPQRPKPKRLRPGKSHRNAVLSDLPAEQRPIAELALQGMGAVRQRLREENDKAVADGRATMPEASVLKLAEEMLPKLRVAEWRDRAEAAKSQADELDLRDLRSVVAASDDPIVARDETTRVLADELKQLLVHKQEQELSNWFGDIDAALAVGRVIRALRLSSQPPKAGVPFPSDIAQRLIDSTNASLAPMDAPDRWAAMLEAAAFSPIRTMVKPVRKPDVVNDELTATVRRLAPALPHVAELFEIEVAPDAPMPKPLRPTGRPAKGKPGDGKPASDRPARDRSQQRPPKPPRDQQASPAADTPASEAAASEAGTTTDDAPTSAAARGTDTDVTADVPAAIDDAHAAPVAATDAEVANDTADVAHEPATDAEATTAPEVATDTADVAHEPATDAEAATDDAPADAHAAPEAATDTELATDTADVAHEPATDAEAATDDAPRRSARSPRGRHRRRPRRSARSPRGRHRRGARQRRSSRRGGCTHRRSPGDRRHPRTRGRSGERRARERRDRRNPRRAGERRRFDHGADGGGRRRTCGRRAGRRRAVGRGGIRPAGVTP